jgi:hypothetical protein
VINDMVVKKSELALVDVVTRPRRENIGPLICDGKF